MGEPLFLNAKGKQFKKNIMSLDKPDGIKNILRCF